PRKRAIQYSATTRWGCSALRRRRRLLDCPLARAMTRRMCGGMKTTSAATMRVAAEAIKRTRNRSSRGPRPRGGRREPLLELLLGCGADLARCELAVLEQHQRRDRHDAVFLRRRRALVDVELDDLDLAVERAGDLLERGRDHAAGAAPLGPEIDHDR